MTTKQNPAGIAIKAREIGWDGQLPVRPENIARKLAVLSRDSTGTPNARYRIEVRAASKPKPSTPCCSAFFDKSSRQFVCEYNPNDAVEHRNLAVAYSIGHLLMGHVKLDGARKEADTFMSSDDEKDAAALAFAYELMMPAPSVVKLFDRDAAPDVSAKPFAVSPAAILRRQNQLALV
ncbi:ImmA/IrrE family metallo-endopeptidase [Pseudomonas aeruginosa]